MSGINISYGPISVDLKKFVDFLKDAVSGDLDKGTKKTIEEAIDEVLSAYRLTVDCVMPFLKVGFGSGFKEQFAKEYSKYIDTYGDFLKMEPSQMPACHKVYDMLDAFSEKRGIKAIIPRFNERMAEIKNLADNWLLNDDMIVVGLENLHNNLQNRMRYIHLNLEADTQKAQNKFNSFINQIEADLNTIAEQMRGLEEIKRSI